MTPEEILDKLFKDKQKHEKYYSFKDDPLFMDYLRRNFPSVYDFVTNENLTIQYKNFVAIAAITIENKKPILYLNPNRITTLMNTKWDSNKFPLSNYETLAGILLHEFLHFELKHFSRPFSSSDENKRYNIAQDMIIDNLVKKQVPGWRNWKDSIEKINTEIEKSELKEIKKISLDSQNRKENEKYILDMHDWEIKYLVAKFMKEIPKDYDLESMEGDGDESDSSGDENKNSDYSSGNNKDTSGKNKEKTSSQEDNSEYEKGNGQNTQNANPSDKGDEVQNKENKNDSLEGKHGDLKSDSNGEDNQQNEANSDSDMGKDKNENTSEKDEKNNEGNSETGDIDEKILDDIFKKAKERASKNKSRNLCDYFDVGDEIVRRIYERKNKNLYSILVKFVRRINLKTKRYTWRKVNKKYPKLFPGHKIISKPGDVVLVVDTSASMHHYLEKYYDQILIEIQNAFEKIEKVFGVPSNFYYVDVSEGIHRRKDSVEGFVRIKKPQELQKINYTLGGGTDYRHIFEKILNWKKFSFHKGTPDKLPDFILFISDFGVDFSFMYEGSSLKKEYKELSNKLIWFKVGTGEEPPIGFIIDVESPVWSTKRRRV